MQLIHTVGHGSASPVELSDVLVRAGVATVVDIRRYPGSRRHPHFNRAELSRWLPERGIEYIWMEDLGGRRRGSPDSPNLALRNDQFRAYADYMASEEFTVAIGRLLELTSTASVATMCAESLWWRCHRRLLADHLVLVEGRAVDHLLHTGAATTHPVTQGARREGERVIYDVSQASFPET